MTMALANSCHRKSVLHKTFKKNPTIENKAKFTKYRNKLKTLLIKAEWDYYKKKLDLYAGNLQQTWKLLGLVLNQSKKSSSCDSFTKDGMVIDNPTEIVEHFNDYFVNIGKNLQP